jgi:uncharacterized protein DUF3455
MISVIAAFALAAAPAEVPAALAVPTDAVLALRAEGRGMQIYVCASKPNLPDSYAWSFKAPQAVLLDAEGHRIGRHYAGPTWADLNGDEVAGKVTAAAPSPNPNAIDWLLLTAKSNAGGGPLSQIRYVQRVRTVGGKPPAGGCAFSTLGVEREVPYSDEYDFYSTRKFSGN